MYAKTIIIYPSTNLIIYQANILDLVNFTKQNKLNVSVKQQIEHNTGLCKVLIFAKFTRFGQLANFNSTNTCSTTIRNKTPRYNCWV